MVKKEIKPNFRKSVDMDSYKRNRKSNNLSPDEAHSNTKANKILEQRYKAKLELINKYKMSEEEAENTLREIEEKAKRKRAQDLLDERMRSERLEIQRQKEAVKRESVNPQRNIEEKKIKQEAINQRKIEEKKIKQEPVNQALQIEEENVITPQHVEDRKKKEKEVLFGKKQAETLSKETKNEEIIKDSIKEEEIMETSIKEEVIINTSIKEEKSDLSKSKEETKTSQSVDELISDLIPEDEKTPKTEEKIMEETRPQEKAKENKEKANVDNLISDLIPESNKELCIEVDNVSLSFEVGNDKIDNLKELFIRTLKRNKEKKQKFQALNNISFKIYKGEKIGIIGYNGAGKSTLLNVITGIYPPEEGEVKTYGRISPLLALGAGFDHNYSGAENIYLNGAILGYSKEFLKSKYDEIVEFSELEEFINFPVKNYSSGMMAKLGFSIATIVDPDILIIDEVLGVGDVNFRKKSQDKLRSLMDSGTTVLLVSHSIPEIRKLCDKAIWIDKGKVREIGEVNEVCNHYLKDAEKATKDQLKDIRFR